MRACQVATRSKARERETARKKGIEDADNDDDDGGIILLVKEQPRRACAVPPRPCV